MTLRDAEGGLSARVAVTSDLAAVRRVGSAYGGRDIMAAIWPRMTHDANHFPGDFALLAQRLGINAAANSAKKQNANAPVGLFHAFHPPEKWTLPQRFLDRICFHFARASF